MNRLLFLMCVVAVSAALSVIADVTRTPNATDESPSPGGSINTIVGDECESLAGSLDTAPSGLILGIR